MKLENTAALKKKQNAEKDGKIMVHKPCRACVRGWRSCPSTFVRRPTDTSPLQPTCRRPTHSQRL